MAKQGNKRCHTRQTATASTPEGELKRHLTELGLETAQAYRDWCRENGFRAHVDKTWLERRQEIQRAQKLKEQTQEQTRLAQHLRALGFETMSAYAVWRQEQGFHPGCSPNLKQQRLEQEARDRERALAALTRTRKQARNPSDTILAIYHAAEHSSERIAEETRHIKAPYLQKIADLFASEPSYEIRASLRDLLLHVLAQGRLFGLEPVVPDLGHQAGNTFLDGLHALARRSPQWMRPLHDWHPYTHNAHRQFGALARHLLASYPLPAFMDCAWFEGDTPRARLHQDWFLHVANGQNVRTARIPLHLTKMAAHHFLLAPPDSSLEAALRRAQVIALGGSETLARAVIATRLGRDLETLPDSEFWQSVVHFFVNHPMLDTAWIGPMIDFIYDRKFAPREEITPDGDTLVLEPVEPTFSMKGRTPEALIRRVEAWHRHLARDTRRAATRWNSCGIGGFDTNAADPISGKPARWQIVELLDSAALKEEGKTMRHCVASYDRSCLRGQTSIWSMRFEDKAAGITRCVMTIAVSNAARTVTQAKGKCNKGPEDRRAGERLSYAPEILKKWAAQEHITVPSYI